MKLQKILFSDKALNLLFIAMLLGLYEYSERPSETIMSFIFWWALKVIFVLIALSAGFFIKDFWRIVCFITFALVMFCLVTIFDQIREEFYFQFFFVAYVIFLGFASIANVGGKFMRWVLLSGDTALYKEPRGCN